MLNLNLSYTSAIAKIEPDKNIVEMEEGSIISLEHFQRLAGQPRLGLTYRVTVNNTNVITAIVLFSPGRQG